MASEAIIAERELFYSLKSEQERKKLTVRIHTPYIVKEDAVSFKFDPGTACCVIEFDGLNERDIDVFGMDSLQALEMATNVDNYLKGFNKKYDFYWLSGEPYFGD